MPGKSGSYLNNGPFGAWGRRDVRASDADRERAADFLRQHAGDGRITMDELSQRVERAYVAQTLGELDGLVRDLPPTPQSMPIPIPGRAVVMPRVRRRMLRFAALRLAVVDGAAVVIWALTGGPSHGFGDFWPIWPIALGGVFIGFRAVRAAERSHATKSAPPTWHDALRDSFRSRR